MLAMTRYPARLRHLCSLQGRGIPGIETPVCAGQANGPERAHLLAVDHRDEHHWRDFARESRQIDFPLFFQMENCGFQAKRWIGVHADKLLPSWLAPRDRDHSLLNAERFVEILRQTHSGRIKCG